MSRIRDLLICLLTLSRKSIGCFHMVVGDCLLADSTKQQSVVVQSSGEAEVGAANELAKALADQHELTKLELEWTERAANKTRGASTPAEKTSTRASRVVHVCLHGRMERTPRLELYSWACCGVHQHSVGHVCAS